MDLLAGIVIGFGIAVLLRFLELHIEDRRHGRIPGTLQSINFYKWAKEHQVWYWPRPTEPE